MRRRFIFVISVLVASANWGSGSAEAARFSSWNAAARHLTAPVYRPRVIPDGVRLASITTQRLKCGDRTVEEVFATYRSSDGLLIRITEGTPFFCGNLGEVQTIARLRIGRSRAEIVTSPNGDNPDGIIIVWNTDWRAKNALESVGTDLGVELNRRDTGLVTRIARGMRLLPL